ncbi:MAG: hypothetical protein M1827_000773 [Pycnora praestabilis]|nr:MAG: hypothetical protein M1827_000773 [Pycnora praestabilis]
MSAEEAEQRKQSMTSAEHSMTNGNTEKIPKTPKKQKQQDKPPAGGFDSTPVPKADPGYTLKFTFHYATRLPIADLNSMSSDPYIVAQLNTNLPTRHKEDPNMRFRTRTLRKTTEPVWNCEWIVAHVPPSGFQLKARIYDEDPADHDDRLGNVHVHADRIDDEWPGIQEQAYKIKKRMGSKRAYLLRACTAMFSKGMHMSGDLYISVQNLGRTQGEGGRMWTVGPNYWTQHLSPMIGRIAGTKDPGKDGTEQYNFQANQFQLSGPVPPELYHRYVEFKPFVKGMFTTKGLRGRVLSKGLHHQHSRVYNYDRTTTYGVFDRPTQDMTLKFLDLVHFDQGGRIFTYVLSLDGLFRFTETGKEFGIDLLSKHTMHSDVSIYIACSGEFFIRRLKNPSKSFEDQETHPPADISNGPPKSESPKDPAYYELIIDNDSGTYRPNAKYLPLLKDFFSNNFPGLKIMTLDCTGDKEKMGKMKREQFERKKVEGEKRTFVQGDGDSMSSSDEEDLDAQAKGKNKGGKLEQGLHAIEEPKDAVLNWAHGDQARERREEEDDQAAIRGG